MRKIDALFLVDHLEVMMTKLEAFSDHFEHLARTTEQRELAAEFNTFVGAFLQGLYPDIHKVGQHAAHGTEPVPFWKEHGHESLADLLKEIREDEEAGKREDVHGYGKESLKNILASKNETPAVETEKDTGIER